MSTQKCFNKKAIAGSMKAIPSYHIYQLQCLRILFNHAMEMFSLHECSIRVYI